MVGGRPSIYTLSDETGVRYVGQTKNPTRRRQQHHSLSNNLSNRKVSVWIRGLLRQNKTPLFTVIEESDNLNEREVHWVRYFRENGVELLNLNEGGKDISHANRAKKQLPWKWSPLQRRLSLMRQTINTAKKRGRLEWANSMTEKMRILNERLKIPGVRDYINTTLWERYGY